VTVHDADEVGGTHFFAMEYVEGTDLSKLVRKEGPLPVREACEYIRQAALGLQHAHEQGLVHRDIKPANLMLTTKGVVKVLDLGLARLATVAEGSDGTDPMTREGSVMGTPDFMAPEQATDPHSADIRADLYSLGCTLFQRLTGKVPYPGGTLTEKLLKHQMDPPPRVQVLRPDVPLDLAAVVLRLMAKKPAERYGTPAELAAALEPFCSHRLPVAIPVGPTVAYTPGEQSHENTQTELPTLGRPRPLAIPVVTLALPAGKAWWQEWSKDRCRLGAVGGGVLLLLIVLLVALWPHKPSGLGQPGDDPKSATWPLDNLPSGAFQAVREFDDWPPKGLVLVLGSHRGRHWGPVRVVAISPDGKLLASAGDDARICVWKADDLSEYRVLRGHEGSVKCLAFSRDSKKSLSGGADKTVWLWEVQRGKEQLRLTGHGDPVGCVAISPDGERALSGAVGGIDHAIRVWDITGKGKQLHSLKRHAAAIRFVAFSSAGRQAISGDADGTVRTWNPDTGMEGPKVAVPEKVGVLAVSPDGKRIASACDQDHFIHFWNMADVQSTGESWVWHPSCAAFFSDSRRIVSGTSEGNVEVYDADARKMIRPFRGSAGITSVAVSSDGGRVASGSEGGLVQLWDVEKGEEIVPRPGHTDAVNSVALSKDGRYAITAGADGTLRLWDLASDPPGLEVPRSFKGHSGAVSCVVLSGDGRWALLGSADKTTRLWEVETGHELRRFENDGSGIETVAFSADDRRALFCAEKQCVMWDTEAGKELRRFTDENSFDFKAGVFSPTRQRIITCDSGRVGYLEAKVRVWDAETGIVLARFVPQPASPILRVAVSPDARVALAGSADGTVRLWDLEKEASQQPAALTGLHASVSGVAFAPDGKSVAASAVDGKVIVWDAASGNKRQEWQLPGKVSGVAFDEKGRHLATANANGTIFILRLPE